MKLPSNKFLESTGGPVSMKKIFYLVLAAHVFIISLGLLLTSESRGTKSTSQVPGGEIASPPPAPSLTPSPVKKPTPVKEQSKPRAKPTGTARTKSKTTTKAKKKTQPSQPEAELTSDLKQRLEKRLRE